jgi:hypothetical protein
MSDSQLVEVYSAANHQEAELIVAMLQDVGIEARVVGNHLQNAVGDLPAVSIAPRVWVHRECYDKARKLIERQQDFQDSELSSLQWTCSKCSELNEAAFLMCWNCQTARDTS